MSLPDARKLRLRALRAEIADSVMNGIVIGGLAALVVVLITVAFWVRDAWPF